MKTRFALWLALIGISLLVACRSSPPEPIVSALDEPEPQTEPTPSLEPTAEPTPEPTLRSTETPEPTAEPTPQPEPTASFTFPSEGVNYTLTTDLVDDKNQCFDVFRSLNSGYLFGAAMMADCGPFQSQVWQIIQIGDGTVKIQDARSAIDDDCLNVVPAGEPFEGRVAMAACGSSTNWLIVGFDASDNAFQLQPADRVDENLCLESNMKPDDGSLTEAGLLAECGPFTGQIWTFNEGPDPSTLVFPEPSVEYTLTSQYAAFDGLCLDGNQLVEGASYGGASFLTECGPSTGQVWTFVATEPAGYFELQTIDSAGANGCLESNGLGGDFLGGATHMADCAAQGAGQAWKLVRDPRDGSFQLTSLKSEEQGDCLYGNIPDDGSELASGVYMDECDSGTANFWIITERE